MMPTVSPTVRARWQWLIRGPIGKVVGAAAFGAGLLTLWLGAATVMPQTRWLATAASLVFLVWAVVVLLLIQGRLLGRVADLSSNVSLNAHLSRSGYSPADFFVDGAAATPGLQLFLAKVLALCHPGAILELGSGQTTKLLALYARATPSAHVLTLEQDADWHSRFSRSLEPAANHAYRLAPLEPVTVSVPGIPEGVDTEWYSGAGAELSARRFDLILVDGPDFGRPGYAFTPYSRCGVLLHLATILSDSFVIVLDDVDRYGELMTVGLLEAWLSEHGRRVVRFDLHGVKSQAVFCSPDLGFLASV